MTVCRYFEQRKWYAGPTSPEYPFCTYLEMWLELGAVECSDCPYEDVEVSGDVSSAQPPRQEEHHGKVVWTAPTLDSLRQEYCLCLHCAGLEECPTANLLFTVCNKRHMALAVTRCPAWSERGVG